MTTTANIFDGISTADLVDAVREIAAEMPDTVYDAEVDGVKNSCVYFKNGCASCLIGHGLARLGVTLEDISAYNEQTSVFTLISELFRHDLTGGQSTNWLVYAQDCQDQGECWGTAVVSADAHMAEMVAEGLYLSRKTATITFQADDIVRA